MALTNTSTAAGGLGRTIGDAVIAFNHVNVMFPLVTVKHAARGSNHVQFSDRTKLTSGNVSEATQATTTTAVAITTAARIEALLSGKALPETNVVATVDVD